GDVAFQVETWRAVDRGRGRGHRPRDPGSATVKFTMVGATAPTGRKAVYLALIWPLNELKCQRSLSCTVTVRVDLPDPSDVHFRTPEKEPPVGRAPSQDRAHGSHLPAPTKGPRARGGV